MIKAKEKPIIFSTPMVQAILEGRKTQTRRVIKPQPPELAGKLITVNVPASANRTRPHIVIVGDDWGIDAHYQPGDILWVQEPWARISDWVDVDPEVGLLDGYLYEADDWGDRTDVPQWRFPIHMPKEAARMFLLVEKVRVERLQEILINDMLAEGCVPKGVKGGQWQQWQRDYFMPLWDSIYAKRGYPWENNPWVWVYEFMRTEARP